MTSDDGEPPIWVPLEDPGSAGDQPAGGDPVAPSLQRLTGIPVGVLAGGAAVVVLAATVVVAIIASKGPEAGPAPQPGVAATASQSPSPSAQPGTPPAQAGVATATCHYSRTDERSVTRVAKLPTGSGVPSRGQVAVKLATTQGDIVVTLDRQRAPCTVNSFLALVHQRFFDATPCHRITTKGIFILQCGDPGGTGTGGPGYSFADEGLPSVRTSPVVYPAGTVAMAGGTNANGSQFFVVYRDTQLMPAWPIFGRVSAGLDVVSKVAAAGSRPARDGKPVKPVTITSVTAAGPG
ncbi:MAG: peptidylprolyl isomerase [Mycobacteriales bacterium]